MVLGAGAGAAFGAAAAAAAWLTSCLHSVEELPLTSMPEPLSSISTSFASDSSDWMMPIWFWELPELALPEILVHWLPLSPPPVTVND